MRSWTLLILLLFLNAWIWRILNLNPMVFSLLIITSILVFKSYLDRKNQTFFLASIIIFCLLTIMQWQTTQIQSHTDLSNDDQRIHDIRVRLYHSKIHLIRLLTAKFSLVNFFEGDFATASYRLQRNFFETLDPNVYFFGGHPRERVWANDFEKFSWLLILPFLVGIYLFWKKSDRFLKTAFLFSLIIFSYFGHRNQLGPFLLFPFIILCIFEGVVFFLNYARQKS